MSKFTDMLTGANIKNMEEMSYKEVVQECLYRADNSKRYQEADMWRQLALINAVMHVSEILERR